MRLAVARLADRSPGGPALPLLVAVLLLISGCGEPVRDVPARGGAESQGQAASPASEVVDLSAYRVVDLSHTYDESTLYWPTSPSRFESETLAEGYTPEGFFYLARRFSTPEHGGTHIDAPVHFAENGWPLDEIPLERLIAPGVVIDVSEPASTEANYLLQVGDVEAWEDEHGQIPEGSIVLLRTGWSRFWPDEAAYYGRPEGGEVLDLHFPSYGAEAARLLIEQRHVAMLGVDTASIDGGQSTDFQVHRIAGKANVPGLENLARLDRLPPVGALVIAAPMRIVGGSGAPVRALALVPR